MKTEDLVRLLACDTQPVRRHAPARRVAVALGLGTLLSLLLMLAQLGFNPDLGGYLRRPMFWVKFGAPLLMAAAAAPLVARLGRPGMPVGRAWLAWLAPLAALWLLGIAVWAGAPDIARPYLLWGNTWRACPENIATLSLPVFLAALWSLRGLAPVRPALAGAGAGALAGATGAAVYALHCPELGAPFIAVWYGLGMAVPVAAGALLGPQVLRW